MVCVLVTSGSLPTEDTEIHLPSGLHIPPVSASIDRRLLMKLLLLNHQLSLPN